MTEKPPTLQLISATMYERLTRPERAIANWYFRRWSRQLESVNPRHPKENQRRAIRQAYGGVAYLPLAVTGLLALVGAILIGAGAQAVGIALIAIFVAGAAWGVFRVNQVTRYVNEQQGGWPKTNLLRKRRDYIPMD